MYEMGSVGDQAKLLRAQVVALQGEVRELTSENVSMRALLATIIESECGGQWVITRAQIERMKITDYVIVRRDNPIDFSVEFTVGEKVTIPDAPDGTL